MIGHTRNSEKRFSGRISWTKFLPCPALRGATTGLVQQSVQIVASHDLTLVVGRHRGRVRGTIGTLAQLTFSSAIHVEHAS